MTKKRKNAIDKGITLEEACAGKTYAMVTMGCQMNAADSERLEGGLLDLGMTEAPEAKDADVIILNTCSIREHAEAKVYSYVGPQAKRKRDGEDVTIVVAGCVAQQEGARLLRLDCFRGVSISGYFRNPFQEPNFDACSIFLGGRR